MSEVLPGIRARRKALGMSQTELAERVGCTFQSVGMWERGETLPAADRLPEIARALGCSIDELYAGDTSSAAAAAPSPEGEGQGTKDILTGGYANDHE